jgi:DNA-directed RNA polymerase subunit H (RpoH/RPB5)
MQIYKTDQDIQDDILGNLVKMLTNRKLLDHNDLADNIKKYQTMQTENFIYKIDLVDKTVCHVKLMLDQKLTGVSKTSGINDFLTLFKKDHKIIVVKDINKKAQMHINRIYPNTEIFAEHELLIDLVSHELVPQHILLSAEEAAEVMEVYNTTNRQMPKILLEDPVSRYYNAKTGMIFKILPPSETAGLTVTYCLVK